VAGCLDQDQASRFDTCVHQATTDAEAFCLTVPCMDAVSDGRITRILPSNDFVPTDDTSAFDGQDVAALMERIEASEENVAACY
jgi:hypothetical protein